MGAKNDLLGEFFTIPVKEHYILYAPLINHASLVNKAALQQIQASLTTENSNISPVVEPLSRLLRDTPTVLPQPRQGNLQDPFFLGLVTTRNCNMACVYCDFAAPKHSGQIMSMDVARNAINEYFTILENNDHTQANIHFFGGEPFFAPEIIDFSVQYAKLQGRKRNVQVTFEVITNGFFDLNRAAWIGDTFSTVVLSLDGPEDIQNRNRPGLRGGKSFDQVFEVAKTLSRSQTNLILRSCITSETVNRIPEIAHWIASEFRPTTWCIEPLTPDISAKKLNLFPPDPWAFAQNFVEAIRILEPYGIRVVNSTVELGHAQISCCPVAQDALIVSPEGFVDACYLLEKDWLAKGMNMRFGQIMPEKNSDAKMWIDKESLQTIRQYNVYERPMCQDCFCRFSCAGGCPVNHPTKGSLKDLDDLCIYTRLITLHKLLAALGQEELAQQWWADPMALRTSTLRRSDRLGDQGAL